MFGSFDVYTSELETKMTNFVIASVAALSRSFKSRKGQSLVEYALVISFLSLLTVAVMGVMGTQIRALYAPIVHALQIVRAAI